MTTTRARLQELGLEALREMAGSIEVEHDGLQKTKLITAIIGSDKFDVKMLPEPKPEEEVAAVKTEVAKTDEAPAKGDEKTDGSKNGDGRQGQRQNQGQNQGQNQDEGGGNRNRRRRNKRRQPEPIDESELEVRSGILDILRATGSSVVVVICLATKTSTFPRIRFARTSCARATSARAQFAQLGLRRSSRRSFDRSRSTTWTRSRRKPVPSSPASPRCFPT